MRNESYKRFSIYKKAAPKRSWLDFLFDWIVKGVIIALLISINFVLFTSSANYSLFAEGLYVIPNIVFPIIVIFAISLGTMFLISFSRLLENLLLSFIVGLFIYVTINQFMIISPDSFLYSIFYNKVSPNFAMNFIDNSDVVTSVTIAIIIFVLLGALRNRVIFFGAIGLAVIFGAVIADEYINQRNKQEFVTLYEKERAKDDIKGNKFIYIMLPSAASYRYLSDIENEGLAVDDIKKTKELMLGFYAKNNFTLYDNAYLEEDDQFMNIVSQFNILSNKKVKDSLLDKIAIDGYLKFKNHNEKSIYLEDNKLFNNFKNANYRINVYQSHGIELCQSNNEAIADKCVEKQNHPFNFQNMNISELQKTKFLLLQWVNSTRLFKDLSKMYSFLNVFTDANKVALIGVPFDNLYVINSINTLDIMFNDILAETSNTTYFALLDIPSEMYVYDEFCNIKPSSEWLSKENLPWVKNPNLAERKKAYMQQTSCLYGKLQQFIDKIIAYGLDKESVIVLQGISGLNDKKPSVNISFINEFRSKKSVTMAIKEPKRDKFNISYDICPVSTVLIKYLYGKDLCRHMDAFELGQQTKLEFYTDMMAKQVSKKDVLQAEQNFTDWYEKWEKHTISNSGVKIMKEMIKIAPEENLVEAEPAYEEIIIEDNNNEFELKEPIAEEMPSIEPESVSDSDEESNEEEAKSEEVIEEIVEPLTETVPEIKPEIIDENENFYLDEDLYNEELPSDNNETDTDVIVDDDELLSIDFEEII
ncbi:MAG: hypothetical protein LBR70_04090 [Lactobacillaceae bacterium]|nr:hypothetical protein [Lactobacillaceae bacterium]